MLYVVRPSEMEYRAIARTSPFRTLQLERENQDVEAQLRRRRVAEGAFEDDEVQQGTQHAKIAKAAPA